MKNQTIKVVPYNKEYKNKYKIYYINASNELEEIPIVYTKRLALLGEFYVLYDEIEDIDKLKARVVKLKKVRFKEMDNIKTKTLK